MMGIVWLVVLVIMVIIEIITLGLTTIWFAGGALAAFIAAVAGASLPIQLVLFFVVSIALLAGTRPFAVKYINRDRLKTNADSLLGTEGIVISDIDNLAAAGEVMVNGLEWSARSESGQRIGKDTVVQIKKIDGVKLIVSEVSKENK